MTTPTALKLTATDLKQAIARRYEPPEWHCESEVTLGGRRLDVVALNLWGARSYRIVGFEIKVSRGDWMRELDQFQKSEEWCSVVDQFYVVTPPKLVREDELPRAWGLLEWTGAKMMTRRHANLREGDRTTLPREVAARFLERLSRATREAERNAAWKAENAIRTQIEASLKERHEKDRAHDREELKRLTTEYNALLHALGVSPQDWRAHEVAMRAAGVYVKFERDSQTIRQRLQMTHDSLEHHVQAVRGALDSLKPMEVTGG